MNTFSDLDFKSNHLNIQMVLLETEEQLPSFKVNLKIIFFHPTGQFNYEAKDIWFDCRDWDDFIAKLIAPNYVSTFILKSMSEQFILALSKENIGVELKEISFNSLNIELRYSHRLTIDDYIRLQESFLGLDKWW